MRETTMTSEITEEMVERLVEQAAHLELGIACRGPDVSNAARELLSQLNAVLPGLRALAARPIEAGSVEKFLNEAARYFENRPTNGEDSAHWSNVYNAESCRKAADLIQSQAAAIAERNERIERLKKALREIRDDPCLDPEGNSAIARAALQQEGE